MSPATITVTPPVVSSVSIRDISAPAAVEAGKELLLDCDFTYNKEEVEEVVVKWFHNNSTTPFYQWVPALDIGPQVGGWILLSLLPCFSFTCHSCY